MWHHFIASLRYRECADLYLAKQSVSVHSTFHLRHFKPLGLKKTRQHWSNCTSLQTKVWKSNKEKKEANSPQNPHSQWMNVRTKKIASKSDKRFRIRCYREIRNEHGIRTYYSQRSSTVRERISFMTVVQNVNAARFARNVECDFLAIFKHCVWGWSRQSGSGII